MGRHFITEAKTRQCLIKLYWYVSRLCCTVALCDQREEKAAAGTGWQPERSCAVTEGVQPIAQHSAGLKDQHQPTVYVARFLFTRFHPSLTRNYITSSVCLGETHGLLASKPEINVLPLYLEEMVIQGYRGRSCEISMQKLWWQLP